MRLLRMIITECIYISGNECLKEMDYFYVFNNIGKDLGTTQMLSGLIDSSTH